MREAAERLDRIAYAIETSGAPTSVLHLTADLLREISGFSHPILDHSPRKIRAVEQAALRLSEKIIENSNPLVVESNNDITD